MTNRDVRWGFIAAGSIARTALAPAVHAATGAALQSVAARDLDRARSLGPAGAPHEYYAGILTDPDVDAIYISLPNDAHADWSVLALEAGKHVLCEKPLGLSSAEVARMTSAADASGRLLVEATWNRWHPRTRRAEAIIRSGLIGTVVEVKAGFLISGVPADNYRYRPEFGGGALYDLGCYAIVASMWATGSGDAVVESAAARPNEHGVDLETTATYRLGDAVVELECAMDREASQWLSIVGTEGTIDLPDDFVTSRNSPSTLAVTAAAWGSRIEHFAPCDPYTLMVENMSAAIRGEAAYLPSATQSADMMRITEAIIEAASA
ncbi:MAG: Gfo/Idh/MocA family oxidoreductase [Actinomycetota bacterium]|nr:Gfo/Idh/MocA family oxidoreductase [Actinomycetota bacterium]